MIEVLVPFVLIMMSWNSSDPGATMAVSQRVFIDRQTCTAAGHKLDELIATVEESEGSAHTWRCVEHAREIEVFQPEASNQ